LKKFDADKEQEKITKRTRQQRTVGSSKRKKTSSEEKVQPEKPKTTKEEIPKEPDNLEQLASIATTWKEAEEYGTRNITFIHYLF